MHQRVRVGSWALGVCWFAWAGSMGCQHRPAEQPASASVATTSGGGSLDSNTRRDFDRNIAAYISLRDRLARTLADTSRLRTADETQPALRALIAQARSDAKPGDVFEPAMQTSLRIIVRRLLDGPGGSNIRASLMDENPTWAAMRINSAYPVAIPVSTMTAGLLAALPRLPDGLEYHFVGSRMVLLDTRAWMIVDFVEHVLK